ncbi:MAG: hypothetical protein RR424_02840 [Oscillospiraceae bacterium]
MKKFARFIYFAVFTCLLLSITSFAYLDPATLTYVIQIVAGAFIAGGAAIAIYWKKIKIFLKKRKNKNAAPAAENTVNSAYNDALADDSDDTLAK